MSNIRSYYPNYFSINDIMVTQTRFQVDVNKRVFNLGFLESQDQEAGELTVGKSIEIPLWLLMDLESYITSRVKPPDTYSDTFRQSCNADAYSLNLGKINKFYYEFGRYVFTLMDDEHNDLLYETCRQRAKILFDFCTNTGNDIKLESKFDQSEIELFQKGNRTHKLLSSWLLKHDQNLQTSEMILNHKKRKRIENDVDANKRQSK